MHILENNLSEHVRTQYQYLKDSQYSGPESSQDSDLNVLSFRQFGVKSTAEAKRHADDWWRNHPTCDTEVDVFNMYIYIYTRHICRHVFIY